MIALDLFCGGGGAGMGLHRAGYEVIGIDINPQPNYPFRFIRADALQPPVDLSRFDLIWASPPCQAYSLITKKKEGHPDLIAPTREMLIASGKPYIIENVVGAPLRNAVKLCGSMFDLGCGDAELRRHRLFECSFLVLTPACNHRRRRETIGVWGDSPRNPRREWQKYRPRNGEGRCENEINEKYTVEEASEAMGIDWMEWGELKESIPPAYSHYLAGVFINNQEKP